MTMWNTYSMTQGDSDSRQYTLEDNVFAKADWVA